MSLIKDLLQSASNGILFIFDNPVVFIIFMAFLIWISIYDLKTMKVRNYQNGIFLVVGLILFYLNDFGVMASGLNLEMLHFVGIVVGFLLLFIPGMILNYPFGGDIKFVAVMGFWVGPYAILLIMIIAVILQIFIILAKSLIKKEFSMKNNFPFAPAFGLAYTLSLVILLLI